MKPTIERLESLESGTTIETSNNECQICYAALNDVNYGFLHGNTIHSGYCENCANRLKQDGQDCPECRATIQAVIKVY